ncbi:YdcF family protein [Sphingobacterium sp.]|uniref:YdcF family protein n=1 Tax=Sphingobacterium sp. TaxID=341027 RepID=UPI0028AEFD78|nr:YdcF family protein [Sphingobacterium sp.]
MKTIIMVLGAPNDEYGHLSAIALDRLYRAYDLAINNDSALILCTGGQGDHFNITDKPHTYYAQNFLSLKGINPARFLPGIPSKNTIEDFSLSRKAIEEIKPDLLIIITSEFHMERVQLISETLIPSINKFFVSVASSLMDSELKPLIEHEKIAVNFLKENGVKY